MLSTAKETFASLKSADFSLAIAQKSVRHSVFYWLKYVVLVSLFPLLVSLFALAYFVPQLPKLITENFPDGQIKIQDGQLTTEPEIISKDYGGVKFLASSLFSRSDLERIDAGVLVTKEVVYLKSRTGEVNSFSIPYIQSLNLSKESLSQWTAANGLLVFAIGTLLFSLLAILTGLLVGGFRLLVILIWSLVASFAVQKLCKREFSFQSSLKFSFYAAVPAMLISVLLQFASPTVASVVQFIETLLFLILYFVWTKKYLSSAPVFPVESPPISPLPSTPRSSPKRPRNGK